MQLIRSFKLFNYVSLCSFCVKASEHKITEARKEEFEKRLEKVTNESNKVLLVK